MNLVLQARRLARKFHAGQFRRDGRTPYTEHLEDVVKNLRKRGVTDQQTLAVGYLHDLFEDTSATPDDLIAAGMPDKVIAAVQAMTKSPGIEYETYLVSAAANPIARQVKIADNLANLADDPSPKQIVKYARSLLYLLEDQAESAAHKRQKPRHPTKL